MPNVLRRVVRWGASQELFSRGARKIEPLQARRSRPFYYLGLLPLFVLVSALVGFCQQNAIQYVSVHGEDSNDGLSWQSAKATIPDAYEALPPCSVAGKSWNHCGDIELGGGKFVIRSQIDIASPFISIRGRGATITILKYTNTEGCTFYWTADPLNAASGDNYAGGLFDLTVEGTGAPAGSAPWPVSFRNTSSKHTSALTKGACGVETRDIEGFQMRGVEIDGFSTGACWWDHAVRYWNERFRVSAEMADCAIGWKIEADSTATSYPGTTFGYGDFTLWIDPTAPGQIGVLESAGLLTYSNVHIIENTAMYTTAFALTNSAQWRSNLINFHFEGPSSATGFSLDSSTIFQGIGPVNLNMPNSIRGTYSILPDSN